MTARDGTLLAIQTVTYVQSKMKLHDLVSHVPSLRAYSDKRHIRKLEQQLARYGHAQFTTDANQYKILTAA